MKSITLNILYYVSNALRWRATNLEFSQNSRPTEFWQASNAIRLTINAAESTVFIMHLAFNGAANVNVRIIGGFCRQMC